MKKLFLITVILLIQSFPSFGNPNGKGIICTLEGNNDEKFLDKEKKIPLKFGFSFVDNKVNLNSFYKKNDDFFIGKDDPIDFNTTSTKIEWGVIDERFELDRKSLKLKEISKTELIGQFQCEVYSNKIYFQKLEELKDKYQDYFNKKLKDNKI